MLGRGLRDAALAFGRQWWRLALQQLLVLVAVSAVLLAAALLLQQSIPGILVWLGEDPLGLDERLTLVGAVTALGALVLALPFLVAGGAAAMRLADAALAGRSARFWRSLAEGLARFLPLLGTFALGLLGVLLAAALFPLVSLAGLLGLAASGLRARLRLRDPQAWPRWPSARSWGRTAIPLYWAWRLAAAAALAVPAAVLERVGPVRALRIGDALAEVRRWRVVGALAIGLAVALALAAGPALAVGALWGEVAAALVGGACQLLALPIPLVVATALYRRAAGPGGRAPRALVGSPVPSRGPRSAPATARVAMLAVLALVASAVVAVPGVLAAAPASASPTETGMILVDDGSDSADPEAVQLAEDACREAGPGCTLRGALSLAQELAAGSPLAAITIGFADAMTISLADRLGFDPSAEPAPPAGRSVAGADAEGSSERDAGPMPEPSEPPVSEPPADEAPAEEPGEETPGDQVPETPAAEPVPTATPQASGRPAGPSSYALLASHIAPLSTTEADRTLTIDGGGLAVRLDGAGRVLDFSSDDWGLVLRGLTIAGGSGGFSGGGVSMRGRELLVEQSTFTGNTAYQGGAIYSFAPVTIRNSTFSGNASGTFGSDGGADLYVFQSATIVNSTFIGGTGASLLQGSVNEPLVLQNAILATNSAGTLACSGFASKSGSGNLVGGRDSTCAGAGYLTAPESGDPVGQLVGPLSTPAGAATPVHTLNGHYPGVLGIGESCPATDQLGAARPSPNGCDPGSVEFDGDTATSVIATPSASEVGVVTLTATVEGHGASVPSGRVRFSFGALAPVEVELATGDGDDPRTATTTVTGLALGETYDYSAEFLPAGDGGWLGSTTGVLQYTVPVLHAEVQLACWNPAHAPNESSAPECASQPWRIGDAETLGLRASAIGAPSGEIVIARLDDGALTPIAAPAATDADGHALFAIPAADIGVAGGGYELRALYLSDDGTMEGTSGEGTAVAVRMTPTVTLSGGGSGVYGDPAAGALTVVVSGPGPVPTGTVRLGECPAVPDAGSVALDADGRAVLDVSRSSVSAGSRAFVARYCGDEAYGRGASDAVDYATTTAGTSIQILEIAPAAPRYGQDVAVTVRVTAAAPSDAEPQGAVTVGVDGIGEFGPVSNDGAITEDDGVADFVVTIPAGAIGAGGHELTAAFAAGYGGPGPQDFADSASAAATGLEVLPAPTSTRLVADPVTSAYGRAVALTATVDATDAAACPAGDVVFRAGTATLDTVAVDDCAEGVATVETTVAAAAIGVGTTTLTAEFRPATGPRNFEPSTGTVPGYVVDRASPAVVVSGPSAFSFGDDGALYGLSVTAPAQPSGTVHPADGTTVAVAAVPADGAPIPLGTTTLTDGMGSISAVAIAALPPGEYTLTAEFAGDARFAAASGTHAVTIAPASTYLTLEAVSGTAVAYGDASTTATVTVENTANGAYPEGDLVLRWNGHEVGRATLGPADDGPPGRRTTTVPLEYLSTITAPGTGWLVASFEPAPGFAPDGGYPSDDHLPRRSVTLTGAEVHVELDATLVLGEPVVATAWVSAVGASAPIVPAAGTVQFLVMSLTGGAANWSCEPVGLVDGTASLDADPLCTDGTTNRLGSELLADAAGTWRVRAILHLLEDHPANRLLTTGGDPSNETATVDRTLTAFTPSIAVDAPASVQLGQDVVVGVTLGGGAIVPTGKVDVLRSGVIVSALDGVDLVDGTATVDITGFIEDYVALRGIGPIDDLTVRYRGDAAHEPATSAPFAVGVAKTGTTTTLDTDHRNVFGELLPVLLTTDVVYVATVAQTAGTPEGYVNLYRGTAATGTPLGQAPVDADGRAAITVSGVTTAYAGDITAVFFSTAGNVEGSTGTLAHSWIAPPVVVTIQGPASTAIGLHDTFTTTVGLDRDALPELFPAWMLPAAPPTGVVAIGDGAGTSCEALLSPTSDPGLSEGACQLTHSSLGAHTMTASYPGLAFWSAGASAPLTTTVAKGTPALALRTEASTYQGLATIPVDWTVGGPTDGGTVEIRLGGATVCTSSELSGSCQVALPNRAAGTDTVGLQLVFTGSPLWGSRSAAQALRILACMPYAEPLVTLPGAGTAWYSSAPNCGGGTGFLEGTPIGISAVADDGYQFTGFQRGSGSGAGSPFTAAEQSLGPNGPPYRHGSVSYAPAPLWGVDGALQPIRPVAVFAPACVPVTFYAEGPGARWQDVAPDTAPNCGRPGEVVSPNMVDLWYLVGTEIRVVAEPPAEHRRFNGWDPDTTTTGTYDRTLTYTVRAGAANWILGRYGNVCYQSAPRVVQPAEGTITLDPVAPNCVDPQTGEVGYAYGTVVGGRLSDAVGTALQTVQTRSITGRIVSDRQWVPERPVTFDGFTGDAELRLGSPTTATDADGVRRTTRPFSVVLGTTPRTVSADYGSCAILSTAVAGGSIQDLRGAAPGTVTVGTPGNCPLGAGFGLDTWYRPGTSVTLTAANAAGTSGFIGWSGLPTRSTDRSVTFTIRQDTTATASFGSNASCRSYGTTVVPAGSLDLEVSWGAGPNPCLAFRPNSYDDRHPDGNVMMVDASIASPLADGAEVVMAYSTSDAGNRDVASLWQRTGQLSAEVHGTTNVVAYACEFVQIGANVLAPDGRTPTDGGASNVDRASKDRLADFLATQEGDCSVGADPRSGYGDYAWTVGTRLVPLVTADPVAYRFLGWSGDVSGTGETPDAPLRVVGDGTSANYAYRVTANFQAICYRLDTSEAIDAIDFPNLPGQILSARGRPKVEVVTNPNCPGVRPAEHMYLGGTPVVLRASDGGDTLFRDWADPAYEVDPTDHHWASVMMTQDRRLVPYFSEKSVGEYITSYGSDIANGMALGAKITAGFVAASASAYLKTAISNVALVVSAVGYVAQGLEALGVSGTVIDGMKQASTLVSNMIDMFFAPLDCISAWSAGGEGTALFAAQNVLGAAIVQAATANPQQAQDATSTLARLKQTAQEAKQQADPAIKGARALNAAKTVYQAGANGGIGFDPSQSAADAWGSAASISVFSSCMSGRVGDVMSSVEALAGT